MKTNTIHLCNDDGHWSRVIINGECFKCDAVLKQEYIELNYGKPTKQHKQDLMPF